MDIKKLFQTLLSRRWLDQEGYYYNLIPKFKTRVRYHQLIDDVSKELKRYHSFFRDKDYVIYFTCCGTYGSYQLPNKIYVNLYRTPQQIANTILHEIMHLQFESEIIKKGMTHEEKERFIDERVEELRDKLSDGQSTEGCIS